MESDGGGVNDDVKVLGRSVLRLLFELATLVLVVIGGITVLHWAL